MSAVGRVRHAALDGRLRAVGRPAYRTVVAAELGAQRLADRPGARARRRRSADVQDRLTAVVKTFERPRLLRRLLASIRRGHPGLRVIVVDDSREPVELAEPGVDVLALPFDSGVSAGKNAGLAAVRTEYVVLLDDDFVLTRRSGLARAVGALDEHTEIDLVGGRVMDLPSRRSNDYRSSGLFPTDVAPKVPPGTRIGGLPVLDKVANFYVARTTGIRSVGWDARLKRTDHTDFFTRARGLLTTVYDDDLRCLHAPDRFAEAYLRHRNDLAADRQVITGRWYSG